MFAHRRIRETEIGSNVKKILYFFCLQSFSLIISKQVLWFFFQERTCGIDIPINFLCVSVVKCWKGSGKCYGIRESFFVRYAGIVFPVLIKEILFTVLLSFILVRLKLHCYQGLVCKNKCSSYLKIVLINIQLCSFLEKMTSWSVSAVMNSVGYALLDLNILKVCLMSVSCYLGPD